MSHLRRLNRATAKPTRKSRGAWLSLFAMLMIFIGPLISQAMPMDQHAGMLMSAPASMATSMDMDMPSEHAACHEQPASVDQAGADHVLWAKCGYCTLLFSCPAITQALAVVALAPPRPADFFNAATQPGHARGSVFPNARSRAPPLLSTR
jgi:hypothetical protein